MNSPVMDIQNTLTIRSMRQEDIPAVQEIDRRSFSLPWPQRAFEFEFFENPGSILWIAEIDQPGGSSKVIGVLVIWLIIDEAHIATIAVAPEYRRQKIARKLLISGLEATATRNIKTATLEVRATNKPAINLYLSLGFEIVGVRHRYYVDNNEDALIMTLHHLDQLGDVDNFGHFIKSEQGGS